MPRYYQPVSQADTPPGQEEQQEEEVKLPQAGQTRFPIAVFCLAFIYFAFSCGLEGFFQSQTFTFGICGPHGLDPGRAASLTTTYFASFLVGRFSGVLLSTRIPPRILILASLASAAVSALLLCLTAATSLVCLFLGTGAVGFTVSLQFASGYCWLAEQVDLTGRGSSVVFLGANTGWLVFPPLAGLVFFSSVGPMGLYYLTLGDVGLQI